MDEPHPDTGEQWTIAREHYVSDGHEPPVDVLPYQQATERKNTSGD